MIKSVIDNDAVVVSVDVVVVVSSEADNCSSPQISSHIITPLSFTPLSSKHVMKVCISSQDGPSSLLSSEEAEEV